MIEIHEVVMPEGSLAFGLVELVLETEMPSARRLEFMALAAQVRRQEVALNEMYQNAREEAALVRSRSLAPAPSSNVVHVDFVRGR